MAGVVVIHIIPLRKGTMPVKAHLRRLKSGRTVIVRPYAREGAGRFLTEGKEKKAKIAVGQTYEYKTSGMSRPAKFTVTALKGEKVEIEFPAQREAKSPKRYLIAASKLKEVKPLGVEKKTPQRAPVQEEGAILRQWQGAIVQRAQEAAKAYGIPITYGEDGRPSDTFADLVQETNMAFIKDYRREARRKDTEYHPVQSTLYALTGRSMRAAASLAKEIRIPRRVILRLSHIGRRERALANELGREPTDREVFNRIELEELEKPEGERWTWNALGGTPKPMDYDEFKDARKELQEKVDEDPDLLRREQFAGEPVATAHIEGAEEGGRLSAIRGELATALNRLGPTEKKVVAGIHIFGYEPDEMAKQLGISEERVESIRTRALNKIRRQGPVMRRLRVWKSMANKLIHLIRLDR